MLGAKTELRLNGMQNGFVEPRKKAQVGLREKLQINEWSFSLILFSLSLAIVLGKIFVNYGDALHWPVKSHYTVPSLPVLPRMSNISSIPSLAHIMQFDSAQLLAAKEKLVTVTRRYEEAVTDTVVEFSSRYGRFMRATLGGLSMICFSWFIIYMDSSEPRVNPLSPFSPSKYRSATDSRTQLNYFVGVVNGILIFICICL